MATQSIVSKTCRTQEATKRTREEADGNDDC